MIAVIRECCTLSRVVWDYSSNWLVVVMTHQRLNTGVYSYNVQWKPIANKYRKGTMKSTLHSTQAALIAARRFKHYGLQAPKGVKERVKSPYSETVILQTVYLTILRNTLISIVLCNQIVLPNQTNHFSEVQSDRAPLRWFISYSELLCTSIALHATLLHSSWMKRGATIRPVLKHGPRSSTGLRVVEYNNMLII